MFERAKKFFSQKKNENEERYREMREPLNEIKKERFSIQEDFEENFENQTSEERVANLLTLVENKKKEREILQTERGADSKQEKNEPSDKDKEADTEPKETKNKSPEDAVEDFLNKYNLKDKMSEDFKSLSVAKKMFVIENTKKRIVDIVKSTAETQYSEDLKEKMKSSLGKNKWLVTEIKEAVKKGAKATKESLQRETKIKNLESEVFKSLISSPEGGRMLQEDLEILVKKSQGETIELDENQNGSKIVYVYTENENYSNRDKKELSKFNDIANKFRNLPYEWEYEKGDRKIDYEETKKKYEKAKENILKIKSRDEKPEEKGKALLEISQIDKKIQMDQILNTHPEFEKEFEKLEEEAGYKEKLKTLGKIANTITGKSWTNRFLIGLGYTTRALSKGALAAAKLDVLTGTCTAAISGTLGYFKGKLRGKETLATKDKEERYGKKTKSKERKAFVEINHLTESLNKLVKKVEALDIEKAKAESEIQDEKMKENVLGQINKTLNENLALLATRVEHSQGKLDKGEVNFGVKSSILVNQMNFSESLNKAIVLKESHNSEDFKNLENKLKSKLSAVAKGTEELTLERRTKFVARQARRGILIGMGFATIGYTIRWLGEHAGWWGPDGGKHLVEEIPKEQEKLPEETEKIFEVPEETEIQENENLPEREIYDRVKEKSENIITEKPITEKEPEMLVEADIELPKPEKEITDESIDKEPTTKIQGSNITWTEPESGGEAKVDENTSKIQGSQIVWTTGESGSLDNVKDQSQLIQGSKIVWTKPESGGVKSIPTEDTESDEDIEQESEDKEEDFHEEEVKKPTNPDVPPNPEDEYGTPVHPEEHDKYGTPTEKVEEQMGPPTEEEFDKNNLDKDEYGTPKQPNQTPESPAENPYNLSEEQLTRVKVISESNLQEIFGEKMSIWENIKENPASEEINSEGITDEKKSFIDYLKKIKEVTKLEPRPETIVTRAETNAEYIKRALEYATTKEGMLNSLKL